MYGDSGLITRLCNSVKTLDSGDIEAFGSVADARIDAELSPLFEVPIEPDTNGDYPSAIVKAASFLAAGYLLKSKYSLTSEGAAESPYADMLVNTACDTLKAIKSGSILVSGLTRLGARPVRKEYDRTDLVTPPRSLRRTGSI